MEYAGNLPHTDTFSLKNVCAPMHRFLLHVHDHIIPHSRNNYHPYMLGHRALTLFSMLLVTVKIFALAALSFSPVQPAYSTAITPVSIIGLTNESRQEFSLPKLTENSQLSQAAQAKAEDMLSRGYFSHNAPDGKTPWDFISFSGYQYLVAGENLAINFTQAESVEQAWMNSPGHKANILNKKFQEIGVGIAKGEYQGSTAIFVVQMFGMPSEQNITLAKQPTEVSRDTVPKPVDMVGAFSIPESSVTVAEGAVQVRVVTSAPAVRVLATYGEKAVMLSPKEGNAWQGSVPLGSLPSEGVTITIQAKTMAGETAEIRLADMTDPASVLGSSDPPNKARVLGVSFTPKLFEQQFYLLFIAVLASCLVLAIAIRKHVQHLSLIANSSLTIILASLLFMAG